ncbi:MAG: hypothetical protein CVU94_06675 [Firmicutes bacterium HGW-Firmicutes-19]|jgi:hypothetical protein|nr:MAG: hypothetical protein CVU94_06675 [Firmicutes bacterium HGW-Firmicutes-19]
MNRQKNPAISIIFFIGILFFFFASSAQSIYFIPFIFPIVFFFIIIQILASARKAQQNQGSTTAKKPVDSRFERDFSKRTSTLKKPVIGRPDAPRATNYGNVSNLPGAHLTKCPKCGADMDDRYDYCFKCKAWLKQ